jgi:putative NIF3 family GTP cyclohydrolase 1 type 2
MGMTIQHVIDTIFATVPGAPVDGTVDTVKSGDSSQEVTGIVTTFMATHQVIARTVELGANMIITHEPTYFNHLDETEWLAGDRAYESKREVLDAHHIVVWRFHDHWHMHQPDGITTGVVKLLGWENYYSQDEHIATIPDLSLSELVELVKARFEMPTLRMVGATDMMCRRVAFVLGSPPVEWQIKAFREMNADVVICGETSEWQVCEYVRAMVAAGLNKAMMILGHEKSEEAGMHYLVEWLQPRVPGVTITHVSSGDPIRFV